MFQVDFKLAIIKLLPILRWGEEFLNVILGELGTAQSHDIYANPWSH